MAGEMDIKVAFVVNLPGDLTAVTLPEKAELYDEEDAVRKETAPRCVAMDSLGDPLGKQTNGVGELRSWVTNHVRKVLIYADKPEEVALGTGEVGVTGSFKSIWTKPIPALVMDPLAPLTWEDLRKTGQD